MLGMPRVDAIRSFLAARRGQRGPMIAVWTVALAEFLSGEAVFASDCSEFNASIDVGFRNMVPLPLSNGGSSRDKLIG